MSKIAELQHNLERAKEYSHRKIVAALALGIECHLMSAYECTEIAEFSRIVHLLGYLGDDFIVRDDNVFVRRLPKQVYILEIKVFRLENHAGLTINACTTEKSESGALYTRRERNEREKRKKRAA